MSQTRLKPEQAIPNMLEIRVISGLCSGVICSGVLNPWDRGLHLSIKHNVPFLSKSNFFSVNPSVPFYSWANLTTPYHGLSQTMVQRTVAGGTYYILQSALDEKAYPWLTKTYNTSDIHAKACVGITAGGVSGVLTNGISTIRYHTFAHEKYKFTDSVKEMYSGGKLKPFFKGTLVTASRDMVFGSVYEILRLIQEKHLPESQHATSTLIRNAVAATFATVISSPLNYVRNIQYASDPKVAPPSTSQTLLQVWNESSLARTQKISRARFFQQQFRIGWGTGRVAVGMALGQNLFECVSKKLMNHYPKK